MTVEEEIEDSLQVCREIEEFMKKNKLPKTPEDQLHQLGSKPAAVFNEIDFILKQQKEEEELKKAGQNNEAPDSAVQDNAVGDSVSRNGAVGDSVGRDIDDSLPIDVDADEKKSHERKKKRKHLNWRRESSSENAIPGTPLQENDLPKEPFRKSPLPEELSRENAFPGTPLRENVLPEEPSQKKPLSEESSRKSSFSDKLSRKNLLSKEPSQKNVLPEEPSRKSALPGKLFRKRILSEEPSPKSPLSEDLSPKSPVSEKSAREGILDTDTVVPDLEGSVNTLHLESVSTPGTGSYEAKSPGTPFQETEEDTPTEEYREKHPLLRVFASIGICVAAALLLALVITKFVAHHTSVEGNSMEPSLSNGDQLIVENLSYYFSEPERFDIVVFPFSEDVNYIKRIIGKPGEVVQIVGSEIRINGVPLLENFGKEPIEDPGIAKDEIVLGDDEYFVLGDNRNASVDSRKKEVGVVKRSEIEGKAWLRFYPLNRFSVVH